MNLQRLLRNATILCTALAAITPLLGIAPASIFLALALLFFLAESLLSRSWSCRLPAYWLPWLCLFLATTASLVFSPDPWGGRAALYKFWLFLLVPLLVSRFSPGHVLKAFQGLFAVAAAASLLTIGQYLLASTHEHGWRVTGFMGHWMTLSGELLLVAVPLSVFLLFGVKPPFPHWAVASLLTVALLLTMTRSVWIAAGVSFLVLLCLRFPTWKTPALFLLAGCLLLLLAPDAIQRRIQSIGDAKDPSNYARLAIWRAGSLMIEAHPLFGVGPQRISTVFYDYHPYPEDRRRSGFFPVHLHNNLLQFAAERGIPCALAWLWLMLKIGWDHWRLFRRAGQPFPEQAVCASGFLAVIALFLAGLFEFNFGDSEVLLLFLFLTAAPYVFEKNGTAPLLDHHGYDKPGKTRNK
jgi:O-antigen ligase